jgi:hypothetical protein
MSVHDYTDAEFRVTEDDPTIRDTKTVTKWSIGNSITIERDADDQGGIGEGLSIHDVIHWVADNWPSTVWKAFTRLAVSGTGLCFHRMDGDTPFRVFEVGLYSVRHCEGKDELLRVWIVPTKQESKRDIIAPVGIDGLICGDWLAEQVERRMEALRDESIDARQRLDRAADALNDFANRIGQASR